MKVRFPAEVQRRRSEPKTFDPIEIGTALAMLAYGAWILAWVFLAPV